MAEKRNRLKETLEWLHHAYWIREFLISSGIAAGVARWLVHQYPVLAPYKWPFGLLFAGALIYVLEHFRRRHVENPGWKNLSPQQKSVSSNALSRSIPHAPGNFDSSEFFRTAYYSPLQDTAANSFRDEAERVRPHDKESFYLDVLAVGFTAIIYDAIWWPLYRSQLRALLALNKKNGIVPLSEFRAFYDEAEKEFSSEYKQSSISFEGWIAYMENNALAKIHPSAMVEITVKGKDFLKYLLHYGRSEDSKRL